MAVSTDHARLARSQRDLVDHLAFSETPAACIDGALRWLAAEADATEVLCRWSEHDEPGFPHAIATGKLEPLAQEAPTLDDRDHPLARALRTRRPVPIEPGTLVRGSPSLVAIALCGPTRAVHEEGSWRLTGHAAAGLLVAGPVTPLLLTRIRWLSRRLGHVLARHRLTARLAASEQRLQAGRAVLERVINAVPDPILLTDTGGRRQLVNAAALDLLTPGENAGERRRRAVSLNHALFEASRPTRASAPESRELFLFSPVDGSELLFEHISARAGRGGGVVSVLRNVTALRRATGELQTNFRRLQLIEASNRAERDRLDLVLDSVSDPIVVTDPDGRLVRMNRHAERLFTTSEPHPRGPAHQAVRENSRHLARFAASLLESDRNTRLRGHLSLTEPESLDPVPVEASAGKLLTEDGELSGLVTILHDRTEAMEKTRLYAELKKASAELERKVKDATLELVHRNELLQRQHLQLEQASALKTQFLANMSHELRTPLNAILGYTSMLLQGVSGDLAPSMKKGLTRVESNSRHLLGVINDILDISRIEAGRMPLSLSEFSLHELVAEVMGEVEPIIARSQLDVRADVDPAMPLLRCDRQKLKQVLLNLLTNALKFTPQGSVRVEARLAPESDLVTLAVVDTGIGIAPADHERIFEDFRQADDSTTREYGGTGLGLAIVRRVVGMLEGQVSLTSAPGQGSRFTVTVPRRLRKR